ncbi:MAG TPA: YlzJ-like family protein [Syntrophomonadaceae bacterium]|nr:YlzJ-like family protein [Syntrophomonadaceae bacterium]HPR93710.1 YlzJ-like family protein [Syntrophomonadaceae bacterium]
MIFYDPDPLQLLSEQEPTNFITVKLPSGGFILAKPSGNYEMQIVNIISTDPQDFMNIRFQPGNTLKMKLTVESLECQTDLQIK